MIVTVEGEMVKECVGVNWVDESSKDTDTVTRAELNHAQGTYRNKKEASEENSAVVEDWQVSPNWWRW